MALKSRKRLHEYPPTSSRFRLGAPCQSCLNLEPGLDLNLWVQFRFGPGSQGPGLDCGQTRWLNNDPFNHITLQQAPSQWHTQKYPQQT